MKHIRWDNKNDETAVHPDWLPVTAVVADFIAKWRPIVGLRTRVGPGLAAAAGTASYHPVTRTIEINTDTLLPGVKASEVFFSDPLFQHRHPLFLGATYHEGAHAQFTTWVPFDLKGLPQFDGPLGGTKIDVLVMLEESRVEKRLLMVRPDAAEFMPSIVFDLLSRDFKIPNSPYGAAGLAALVLARADAGTVRADQVGRFRDAVLTQLTTIQLRRLAKLWRAYHDIRFSNGEFMPYVPEMSRIASEWLEIVGVQEEAPPPPMAGESGAGGGEGEEGSADGALGAAAREAAAEAGHDENIRHAEAVGKIKKDHKNEERAADAQRAADGEKAEEKAFRDHQPPSHGMSRSLGASMLKPRNPTPRERAAASKLAAAMQRVTTVTRSVTKIATAEPGGRLRGRMAVQRAAQRSTGAAPTALPWQQRRVQRVEAPKLRVGAMIDISASMKAAAEPLGSTAYVIGNAVHQLHGMYAQVVFGEIVYGITKPGHRVDQVPVVLPYDGHENVTDAFLALDSVLDLIDGDGAKILFLVSDGHFVSARHATFAKTMMRLCYRRGVTVIHVNVSARIYKIDGVLTGGISEDKRHGNPVPPVDCYGLDPVDVAEKLGGVVVEAVAAYQRSRGKLAVQRGA